ncbi:MAG: hypothetical protein ACRD2H_05025 [Terriglobales bacterium]
MDLRTPIGLMFTAIGVLLTGFGWLHRSAVYLRTGLNIDLIWGLVLLAFGIFMLALAWRAHVRAARASRSDATAVRSATERVPR